MEITEPAAPAAPEGAPIVDALPEVERNLRHNFTFNLLNSSFLTFGASLVSSGVILPLFVSNLSNSKVLVGLIMTITFAGAFFPQLFAAPVVARFPQVKKFLVPSVFLAERLPLLLLGPAIFVLAPLNSRLALVVFFILLTWNAVGAGFNAVGVQELYARIIPLKRRGRLAGITGAVGIGLALIGAFVNRGILAKLAFPNGYALLFLVAGVSSFLAWLWLTRIREPRQPIQPPAQSFASFFKKIPAILAKDSNYTRFLIAMCVLYLGGMSGNFLAVAAKERWGLPESTIVTFPIAMYVGQALGNLICGWIGDRIGYKVLQIIANAANVVLLLVAIMAQAPWLFYVIFALKGLSIAADVLGNLITLEFSAVEMRPTYIGIYNTASGVVFIFSPLFAGWMAERIGYIGLFWITAAITAVGILMLQFMVRDPRTLSKTPIARRSIL
jgi:MFS family permease